MDSADSRLLLSFQRSFSLETPQLNLPSRVIRAAPGHVIGDRDGRAGAQPAPLGDPRHAGRFFFFSGLMVTNPLWIPVIQHFNLKPHNPVH